MKPSDFQDKHLLTGNHKKKPATIADCRLFVFGA